jgi:hypothetical protein
VAALLLAAEPGLTAAQLWTRLTTYAVDVGTPGPDILYGAGIVNARNSLTQSLAPPQDLYVSLLDAVSGALLTSTAAAADGSYAFIELPDADYLVYAGQDEDGDQVTGTPGRRWGTLGGSATPSIVTVDGAANYAATFTVGYPIELESNDTFGAADFLPIGGYLHGVISASLSDLDVSRVLIPTDGQYTFETSAVDGACGFALGEDTILGLYDDGFSLLLENDDIDLANLNYCSRITTNLTAGTYYVAVSGYWAVPYRVQARAGG